VKGRILIVDDEPDMLALLREALEMRGHEVFTANAAMSGLNEARRHLPDVVLLDVLLGDMDGLSACEILRSQPSTARTPVIIMTAMVGEMVRFNSFAAGAIDFVGKPISPRDVVMRIESMLASKVNPSDSTEPGTWEAPH
jgi:DNA-binding response OmpR family regulator